MLFTQEVLANGTVSVDNFPATQPVTGPLTDAELRATAVPVSGPLTDTQLRATPVPVTLGASAGVPTVSRVAVSTTVATLASASATRKRLIIYNETGTLHIKLGSACTTTDYTYRLTANATLDIEFPQSAIVTAIKVSGSSFAQVTSID